MNKAFELGYLIFSEETFAELGEVITRAKFDKYLSHAQRSEFLHRIEDKAIFIEVASNFNDCRDPKDNIFLNLAFDSNADCIITGDNDLIVLHPFKDIPIITPTEFLNQHS